MFSNFKIWKFTGAKENIVFFLSVFTGILVFYLIIKRMNKSRNDDVAFDKVIKRLKGFEKNTYYFVKNYVMTSGDTLQGIFIDKYGIILLRAIGFGIYIDGSYTGKKWKLADNSKTIEIDNPLFLMNEVKSKIENILSEKQLINIPIETLVVFADNFKKPEINLGNDSHTLTYDDLKKWNKKRKNIGKMNYCISDVVEILKKI